MTVFIKAVVNDLDAVDDYAIGINNEDAIDATSDASFHLTTV